MTSVLCLAAAAALIGNGSFEDLDAKGKPIGWAVPKYFTFEKGAGMNGTVGLAFHNPSDLEFYQYPSAPVPFEPGKRYEYSVAVKTEDLKGAAMLCVEWYDKDGKWISGSYQNGFKGTHGWSHLKGVTPPIPKEAVKVRAAFGVLKKTVGKAWFDDFSVRLLERPVLGGVYSDVYRNVAADGKVKFHAAVNVKDHSGAKVFFSFADAAGRTVRNEAPVVGAGADLEVEVKALKPGEQEIAGEVVDASGKTLERKTMSFNRVATMPERRAWINRKGRLIVDGKPFFPLGIYLGGVSDKELDRNFVNGPFNCAMPYQCTRAGLDRCCENGIKVMFPLNACWPWVKLRPKGVETDEQADAWVEKKIAEVKDHPALIAWYVNDEIPIEKYEHLLRRQKLIERVDPGHPTWAVLYQFGEVRSYYPTFDVIGTDPYPVPQSPIGNVSMWTRTTREETMGLKPMWQVPQTFGWGDWSNDPKRGRMPTRAEMVNMFWQCLANGANGLVAWCFRLNYRKDGFDYGRWADTCAAAASVKPYIPVFLSDDDEPEVRGMTESLSARAWKLRGKTYLAVVNNTRETVGGELSVASVTAGAQLQLLEGMEGCTLTQGGNVKVSLPGLGFAFLRLEPANK